MKVIQEASCLFLPNPTGIARYSHELLHGCAARAAPGDSLGYAVHVRRLRNWRLRPRLPTLSAALWANGIGWHPACDLVHGTAYRLPPWRKPRKVVTFHDLYAAAGVNFESPEHKARELAVYRDLLTRADFVICDSEHTRQDLLRYFPFPEERTRTIHLGVGADFQPRPAHECEAFRHSQSWSRPYLLFVGTPRPNKNLARFTTAFGKAAASRDYDLVVAGRCPPETIARLRASAPQARLHFPARLTDQQLPLAYAAAAAVALPSVYEGFGFPILEGMASGVPVLTSTGGACPETAGGHAELVDPLSESDMARGIDAVLRRRPAQCAAAQKYAAEKTWQRTADATWDAYRATLDLPARS